MARAEGNADRAAGRPGELTTTACPPPIGLLAGAERLFGTRLALAGRYAALLATDGVVRGLIGPREGPRIWERHVLNCAVIAELVPEGARLVDIGSGAGLPGLVLAVARPDLAVVLVEPLERRTTFLTAALVELGLDNVTIVRARAEQCARGRDATRIESADVVTARAVAPLDRLAAWCLPLSAVGGRLLAVKGETAAQEVSRHRSRIARLGGGTPVIHRCGVGIVDPPTTVVEIPRSK